MEHMAIDNAASVSRRAFLATAGVAATGAALPGGEAEGVTNEHGMTVVEVELPLGAASKRRSGDCAGRTATSLEAEVMSVPPVTTRLCVPVAPKALVLPRLERPLVVPGAEVAVKVQRPGIRATVEADIAIFRFLMERLEERFEELDVYAPSAVVDESGNRCIPGPDPKPRSDPRSANRRISSSTATSISTRRSDAGVVPSE